MANPFYREPAPADATGYEPPMQDFKIGGRNTFIPYTRPGRLGATKAAAPQDVLPERAGDRTAYMDDVRREAQARENRAVMSVLGKVAEGAIDGPGVLLRALAKELYGSEESTDRLLLENADLLIGGFPLAILKTGKEKAFARLKEGAQKTYDDIAQASRDQAARRMEGQLDNWYMGSDPAKRIGLESDYMALREGRSGGAGHLPATPQYIDKNEISSLSETAREAGVSPYELDPAFRRTGPYDMPVSDRGPESEAFKLLSDPESFRYAEELDPASYVLPKRAGADARLRAAQEEMMARGMQEYTPGAYAGWMDTPDMIDFPAYMKALESDSYMDLGRLRMNPNSPRAASAGGSQIMRGNIERGMPRQGAMGLEEAQAIFGNPLLTQEQKFAAMRMLGNSTPAAHMQAVLSPFRELYPQVSPEVGGDLQRRFLEPLQQRVDFSDARLSESPWPILPNSDNRAMDMLMEKLSFSESDAPWLRGGGFDRAAPFSSGRINPEMGIEGMEYLTSPAVGSPLYMMNPQARFGGLELPGGAIAPNIRRETVEKFPTVGSVLGAPRGGEAQLFGGVNYNF